MFGICSTKPTAPCGTIAAAPPSLCWAWLGHCYGSDAAGLWRRFGRACANILPISAPAVHRSAGPYFHAGGWAEAECSSALLRMM